MTYDWEVRGLKAEVRSLRRRVDALEKEFKKGWAPLMESNHPTNSIMSEAAERQENCG